MATTAAAAEEILKLIKTSGATANKPFRTIRLKPNEFKKNRAQLDARADELARQIHNYSNVTRVIDLNAYLKLIEDFAGSLSSEENLYLLQKAQEAFENNFGAQIKNRGESTKIVEQIIKRTGRESKQQLEILLAGYNAEELAKQIRNYEDIVETEQLILVNNLKYLNRQQLSEVLWEFERIPANKIADFIYQVLTKKPDRLTLIAIVLKNKHEDEINEIIECLEDRHTLNYGKDQKFLKDLLTDKTSTKQTLKTALNLFKGFEIEPWIEKIKLLVNNYPKINDILAKRLIQRINQPFYNVNSYQDGDNPDHYFQPFLLSAFNFLTEEQFEEIIRQVNQSPNQKIQIEPTALEDFFSEKLVKVINRLEKAFKYLGDQNIFTLTFSDYAFALNQFDEFFFYDAEEPEDELLLAVFAPLFCIEGKNLHKIKRLLKSTENKHIKTWLSNLSGLTTDNLILQLAAEGLALRLDRRNCQQFLEQIITEAKLEVDDKIVKYADKIASFIDDIEASSSEKAIQIINLLMRIPYQQVEDLYLFYAQQYKKSLIKQLSSILAPAAVIKLRILIEGFNPQQLVDNTDLTEHNIPHRLDPLESAWLQHEFRGKAGREDLQYTLGLLPHGSAIKNKLFSKWKKQDTEDILKQFPDSQSFSRIERIYDFQFASFELSAEPSYGNLRNTFLLAAINNSIEREEYCQIINRSENLPINLTKELVYLAKESERVIDQAKGLQAVFRERRTKLAVIRMLYLILDQQKTLRERIYQFNIYSRDESRTLILLDGYDAEFFTNDVIDLINSDKLTLTGLIELLTSDQIPADSNWQTEIHHQIRLIYEEKTGRRILEDIIKNSNCSAEMALEEDSELNKLANFFYAEMAKRGLLIHLEAEASETTEDYMKILNKILTYKPAQIERLAHYYYSLHQQKLEDIFSGKIDSDKLKKLKDRIADSINWEEEKLQQKIEFNKRQSKDKDNSNSANNLEAKY